MKHRAVVTLLHMKHPELRQLLEYYRRGVFKTLSNIYSRGQNIMNFFKILV